MSDPAKLAETRALYENLDRMSRNTKRVNPSAPWIIPALITAVVIAGLFCLAVKLIAKYILSKQKTVERFDRGSSESPSHGNAANRASRDDQNSISTATPKTCGPLTNMSSKHQRAKPPPVSLYQMKQKKSPGSSSGNKIKLATLQVGLLRAAHNRGGGDKGRSRTSSDENSNNGPGSSPVDMSQRSSDTEEVSQMSPLDDSQAGVGANEVVESHHHSGNLNTEQEQSYQQQAESDI